MKKSFSDNHISTALIIITILFILCLTISLIEFNFNRKKSKIDNVEVIFGSSGYVEINDKLPLSDKLGKNYTAKDCEDGICELTSFTLKNTNSIDVRYDIYVTKVDFNSDSIENIKDEYVKLYLTDDNDVAFNEYANKSVFTFKDLDYLSYKNNSKLLYSSVLPAKSVESFKLRVWVSDNYVLSDKVGKFKFNIGVKTIY